MGKPPCRTELGPPASCDQGAWRLPASPFYTSSTESKLHSGTLLGLRERPGGAQTQRLSKLAALHQFVRMYAPHEAREDTVLFPALHKIVSRNEYDALGEDFEKREHQLFGKEGFEGMVPRVEQIEKQLGIYDLSQFTPR